MMFSARVPSALIRDVGDPLAPAKRDGTDGRWFSVLVTDERAKLTRIAERILRSGVDAEDVVQEAFLRAWRHGDRYDATRGTESAWLCTIVRSVALDLIRSRNAAKRQPAPDVTSVPQELESSDSDACHQLLRNGIDLLPEIQRALIDLAYFEGLSHSQVAKATNLPIGTVKSRLRSAISNLRLAVPRNALDSLLIDRSKAARDRVAGILDERLLRHAADMYFVDFLEPGRRLKRSHWGHVDAHIHSYLDGIWRFAPGTQAHQHPTRQALGEERTRFMLDVSDVWQQEIAISEQHLSFMRKLSLRSLICQPLFVNGKTIGALTLIRTTASHRHFTHGEVADAHGIAAGLANVFTTGG